MDTEDVKALTDVAAKTLVGLMVTDVWPDAKKLVRRLWDRLLPECSDASVDDLEKARDELRNSRDRAGVEEELEIEWKRRLARLIRSDPSGLEEIQSLAASLQALAASLQDLVGVGREDLPINYAPDSSQRADRSNQARSGDHSKIKIKQVTGARLGALGALGMAAIVAAVAIYYISEHKEEPRDEVAYRQQAFGACKRIHDTLSADHTGSVIEFSARLPRSPADVNPLNMGTIRKPALDRRF